MIFERPMCDACVHLLPSTGKWACKAFPDGIPDAVIDDGLDHRKPIDGDQGVRFEQDTAKHPFNFEAA